jgi:hypothetical protein
MSMVVSTRAAFADDVMPPNTVPDTRDHLEPVESVYDEQQIHGYYAGVLTTVLSDGFDNRVRLRMQIAPSFRPESIVGLRQNNDGAFEVFVLQPEIELRKFASLHFRRAQLNEKMDDFQRKDVLERIKELEAALPANLKDVRVRRCAMSIGEADAKQIVSAGELLLQQTRYFGDEDVIGSDGDRYYFWAPWKFSGTIWEPSRGLKPGRMVDIMETLRSACERADRTLIVEAVSAARNLEKDLSSTKMPQ